MKTCLIVSIVAILAAVNVHGQGIVFFANNSATAVYCDFVGGQRVPVGSAFQVELLYAPDGTPVEAFDLLAVRLGPSIGFAPLPGVFNGGTRTAPTATPGGFGLFQVRVWEAAYGSSYMEVIASGNPNAHAGKSAVLRVDTGNPTGLPGTPGSLITAGLTSFSIGNLSGGGECIPEPSTIAISLLGLSALCLMHRRKKGAPRLSM